MLRPSTGFRPVFPWQDHFNSGQTPLNAILYLLSTNLPQGGLRGRTVREEGHGCHALPQKRRRGDRRADDAAGGADALCRERHRAGDPSTAVQRRQSEFHVLLPKPGITIEAALAD